MCIVAFMLLKFLTFSATVYKGSFHESFQAGEVCCVTKKPSIWFLADLMIVFTGFLIATLSRFLWIHKLNNSLDVLLCLLRLCSLFTARLYNSVL